MRKKVNNIVLGGKKINCHEAYVTTDEECSSLTSKKKKQINRLCNKLLRLTDSYRKLEKEKVEIKKERSAVPCNDMTRSGKAKRQYKIKQIDKWNASFWSKYGIINTEVRQCVSALRKHSSLLNDKQKKKVDKLIYNAVKA